MPQSGQFRAQFMEIVNLAVEHDRNVAIGRVHGLVTAGEIDDRKAPMSERNAIVKMKAVAIGTPVRNAVGHAVDQATIEGSLSL
jgi:hypothetical protein